ncbi:MAG: hypothetical protein Q8P18_11055 [Pseudomonadota bacterium]|nr:hypothetical protein [Pseudomonadota bacterium]
MRVEDEEIRDDARVARALQSLPGSSPASLQRVRARIAFTRARSLGERLEDRRAGAGSRDFPRWRGLRLIAMGAAAGTLAAAGLQVARVSLEPVGPTPVALASTLGSSQGWEIHTSIPNVALSFDGTGTVEGQSDAPQIKWDSGLINVEVTPERDVRLALFTREAEVRVVGTGFTVLRDSLGTRIDVRHGRVEVDCGEDATVALEAGDGLLCLPQSAAGLLGRARALQAAGAPSADALAALDRGLAIVGPQAAVRDELVVRRIRALFDLSRHGEVIDAARAYTASGGGGRQSDVEKIAAASASVLGGCAVAAPWLLDAGANAVAACEGG